MNNFAAPVIMAIKPRFAKMIYEGKNQWEFRKAPPPLMRLVLVYESAPVSAITGTLFFRSKVEGIVDDVWETVTRGKVFELNLTGIGLEALKDYVGKNKTVAALRVACPERIEEPIKIAFRPPMTWCTLDSASMRSTSNGGIHS